MTVEVLLPQSGMGMQDGLIRRWYKAEGEAVNAGEALCEVEAAKAVLEVEAPVSGILARILVPAEQTALVREVIAIILETASNTSGGTDSRE
jgi:pyruvate dehydrogenase E2 component (dihydrolipoamide acetyltransferase)